MTDLECPDLFDTTRHALCRACAVVFCVVLACFSTAQARAETVTVFAAASLKPLFDALSDEFHTRTGHEAVFNYAGSSLLARQIALGAPAEVYASANQQWMDYLQDKGQVSDEHRFDLARNRLALVSSSQTDEGKSLVRLLADLGVDDQIAMGLVTAVPAGQYGKAALRFLGLWESVQPQVVQVDNVRAALSLVALAEVRLGIVYATDALQTPNVFVVDLFPEHSHDTIIYPVAAIGSDPSDAAQSFLAFLGSDFSRNLLVKFGFIPVER